MFVHRLCTSVRCNSNWFKERCTYMLILQHINMEMYAVALKKKLCAKRFVWYCWQRERFIDSSRCFFSKDDSEFGYRLIHCNETCLWSYSGLFHSSIKSSIAFTFINYSWIFFIAFSLSINIDWNACHFIDIQWQPNFCLLEQKSLRVSSSFSR